MVNRQVHEPMGKDGIHSANSRGAPLMIELVCRRSFVAQGSRVPLGQGCNMNLAINPELNSRSAKLATITMTVSSRCWETTL
jgi:hypothetical protein